MAAWLGFSGTPINDLGCSNDGGSTTEGITALSWWEYRCTLGLGREKLCFLGNVRERVLIGGGRFRAFGTMVCETVTLLALRRWYTT